MTLKGDKGGGGGPQKWMSGLHLHLENSGSNGNEPIFLVKPRIRETKHLLIDADISTKTTIGLTKNIPKPNFFEKRKKSTKTQKLKKHLEICQD